jgi:hypothetical protein
MELKNIQSFVILPPSTEQTKLVFSDKIVFASFTDCEPDKDVKMIAFSILPEETFQGDEKKGRIPLFQCLLAHKAIAAGEWRRKTGHVTTCTRLIIHVSLLTAQMWSRVFSDYVLQCR